MSHNHALVPSKPNVLQDSVLAAQDIKRKILKDGGKSKNLLKSKMVSLNQELKATKQNIVKHVIQSRAIEQSKTNLLLIQQSLHSHLTDKSDPEVLQNAERRKQAQAFYYATAYPIHTLQTIDKLVNWNIPGLLNHLIEKIYSYSNKEFINALEANPLPDDQITLELYIQIVSNGTNFMLTRAEIETMYYIGIQLFDQFQQKEIQKNNSNSDFSLWKILKLLLYRKLMLLFLIQQATLFIQELEKKIQYKDHFQYQTNNNIVNSSKNVLSSISVDHSNLNNNNRNLLSSSLSSLDLKRKKLPPASSSSLVSLSSASSPRAKLEYELQQSLLQQSQLKERIVSNFHQIVLQESHERKQQSHLNDFDFLNMSESSTGIPSKRKLQPTLAMKQYYYNIGLGKLFQFLVTNYIQKLMQSRFQKWKKVSFFLMVSKKVQLSLKEIGYYRLYRVLLFNYVRRLSNRFSCWLQSHQQYKEQEQLSAIINIQRFWRGYLARQKRKKLSSDRAATCINGIMKIFFAKKILHIRRLKKLKKSNALKISKVYRKYKFRSTVNQRILQKQQMKSIHFIQRSYRGYKGRVKVNKRRNFLQMIQGALKLQCLFRRYKAIVRTERVRIQKRRFFSALVIQKHIRRKLQTLRFNKRWKRHLKAKTIQYAWLRYKARKIKYQKLQIQKTVEIQRIIRGKLGKRRFYKFYEQHQEQLKKRRDALQAIQPVFTGFLTRRTIKPILQEHLSKRRNATILIQTQLQAVAMGQEARKKVAEIKKNKALARQKWKAAIKIQSRMRIVLAKKLVKYLFEQKKRRELLEELKVPYYYRLKKTYFSQQNIYHFKYALRIQCMIRRFLARKKIARKALENEIAFIESLKSMKNLHMMDPVLLKSMSMRLGTMSKSAKLATGLLFSEDDDEHPMDGDELLFQLMSQAAGNPSGNSPFGSVKRSSKTGFRPFSGKDGKVLPYAEQVERFNAMYATIIQKFVRGYLTRFKLKRKRAIPPMKWFCRETIIRYKIKKLLTSWREIKAERERQRRATTQIQRMIRGKLKRKWYKKNFRMLVRQLEIRIRNRRIKSALTIQCAFRCYRARKRVRKQRRLLEEKEKERKELQALEASITGLHDRWMKELMAIRAQTGMRGYLARRYGIFPFVIIISLSILFSLIRFQ
jgi:hypothetical protein